MAKNVVSMKAKKPATASLEEFWKDAHEVYLMGIEAQIVGAKRIDAMLNIRDLVKQFNNEVHPDIEVVKDMRNLQIAAFERMLAISKDFKLEDFMKRELQDFYAELMPEAEEISTEAELLPAAVLFLAVRPYGDRLIQLHKMVQDEIHRRHIEPTE